MGECARGNGVFVVPKGSDSSKKKKEGLLLVGEYPARQLVLYEKNVGWITFWELNPEVLGSLWLMACAIWGGGVHFGLRPPWSGKAGRAPFEFYPGILPNKNTKNLSRGSQVTEWLLAGLSWLSFEGQPRMAKKVTILFTRVHHQQIMWDGGLLKQNTSKSPAEVTWRSPVGECRNTVSPSWITSYNEFVSRCTNNCTHARVGEHTHTHTHTHENLIETCACIVKIFHHAEHILHKEHHYLQ
jgi:hypothetical protein